VAAAWALYPGGAARRHELHEHSTKHRWLFARSKRAADPDLDSSAPRLSPHPKEKMPASISSRECPPTSMSASRLDRPRTRPFTQLGLRCRTSSCWWADPRSSPNAAITRASTTNAIGATHERNACRRFQPETCGPAISPNGHERTTERSCFRALGTLPGLLSGTERVIQKNELIVERARERERDLVDGDAFGRPRLL